MRSPVGGAHVEPGLARPVLQRLFAPVDVVARWGERGRFRKVLVEAILVGLVLAGVVLVISGWEWIHVRGWPVEQATIIKKVPTGETEGCGKSSTADVYLQTWLSGDPPRGLPAKFTNEEGCDAGEIGDVDTVVRVVNDDGSVHVWDEPATSLIEVLGFSAVGLVGGWLLGVVFGLVAMAWKAAWGSRGSRRRRRR